MSTEISVSMRIIRMMSGMSFYLEASQVEKLEAILASPRAQWPQLIEAGGQRFNPASIEGIYTPEAIEGEQRRKNGQWICKHGTWHDRHEKCECIDMDEFKRRCETALAFYRKERYWPTRSPSRIEICRTLGITFETLEAKQDL